MLRRSKHSDRRHHPGAPQGISRWSERKPLSPRERGESRPIPLPSQREMPLRVRPPACRRVEMIAYTRRALGRYRARPVPAHPDPSRCRLGQAHGRGTVVRDTHPSDTGPPVREACR